MLGDRVRAAHARTHPPRMVPPGEGVVQLEPEVADGHPARRRAELVEAAVILHGPTPRSLVVGVLFAGRHAAGPGELAAQRRCIRGFDHHAVRPQRLEHLDAEGAGPHREVGSQRSGDPQVVLAVAVLHAQEAVAHVGVLVVGQAVDDRRGGVLYADGPPVEEPVVAGDGVVEGGRRLVHQALVEWREHAVPPCWPASVARLAGPVGRQAIIDETIENVYRELSHSPGQPDQEAR